MTPTEPPIIEIVEELCEHEWIEDSYPSRECGLCGLVAESPEPTYDQGDT